MGPRYKKPEILLPEKYSLSLAENQNCNEREDENFEWWNTFENPELTQLIEQGLEENYDVRIALEKIEESRNIKGIATGNLFPQINFFGYTSRSNKQKICSGALSPLSNLPTSSAGINTLWEIDVWGKLRKNKNAATFEWQADIAHWENVSIMVAAEIATTYIAICSLQKKINILDSKIIVDEKIIALYEKVFSSGLKDEQNVLERVALLDELKAQIIELNIELETSLNKLAYLVGKTPDQLCINLDAIKDVPFVHTEKPIGDPYDLLRRRPDIQEAENLLIASNEHFGAAIADWFPKVSLLGLAGILSFPALTALGKALRQNLTRWTIGPIFQWPIIDFGRIRFNVKAKESIYKQARLKYEKTVINAVKEVESWLVSYIEEKSASALLQEELNIEKKRFALTADLFFSGLNAEQALLANERRLYTIALKHTDAQTRCAHDFVMLYKSLGGSW